VIASPLSRPCLPLAANTAYDFVFLENNRSGPWGFQMYWQEPNADGSHAPIAVVPTDVARYYASYGMLAMLPVQLSCTMDWFGIITRTDWLLSPAAKVVLQAIKSAAINAYDRLPTAAAN